MSKKSVVTITVMACLLAVAVASTIVLAAFQAQKTATTTVTFSNGVQIKVEGAYTPNGSPTADVVSKSAVLVWGCTEGSGQNAKTYQKESAIDNVSNNITFEAITFDNGTSAQSTRAWLIAKATITSSNAIHQKAVIITRASGWTQIGSSDWYVYGSSVASDPEVTLSNAGFNMTEVEVDPTNGYSVPFITAASITPANMKTNDPTTYAETDPTIDDLAGASFTATVSVFAVNAGAADAATAFTTAMGS